jgi:hypothetical protein
VAPGATDEGEHATVIVETEVGLLLETPPLTLLPQATMDRAARIIAAV